MLYTVAPLFVRIASRNKTGNHFRMICTTNMRSYFYETDRKKGYPSISDYRDEAKTPWQKLRQGWKFLGEELKVWRAEVREHLHFDPTCILRPGEVDVQWRFEGDPSILEKWVVTSDSDYGEGRSTASVQLTKTGRGLFTGNLDPQAFQDGKIKKSGYCNLTSVPLQKSFGRHKYLDWGPYTHIVLRVRGDGRNYLLLLSSPGQWDITWNDSFQYVLHTRGGPYWQYVKIPFSKFFFVSHGRVQDKQRPPHTMYLSRFGITAADKIPGNFKLEIDYIGVEYDPIVYEEHAYETYISPHPFVV